MSLKRLTIDGYGQLELNQVAFRRDGRIEAQSKLSTDDFMSSKEKKAGNSAKVLCENGMILVVDYVTRTIRLPSVSDNANTLYALNYSTEHMYSEKHNALKDFYLIADDKFDLDNGNRVYPRLGFLSAQDRFTTNCICYDTDEFATEDALIEAINAVDDENVLYGGVSTLGAIKISKTAPTNGPVLIVRDKNYSAGNTMPDGTFGVSFACVTEKAAN